MEAIASQIKSRKKYLRKKKTDKRIIYPNELSVKKDVDGEIPTVDAYWVIKNDQEIEESLTNILLKFCTKQAQYAVSTAPISVKENSTSDDLNEILKLSLSNAGCVENIPTFEFMINGKLLKLTLATHLKNEDISFESTVDVQYFERHPPPTPKDNLEHDDWVSSIMCCDGWLLTGCYDNTIQLWEVQKEVTGMGKRAHKLTIPAHNAPVKAVAFINTTTDVKSFVSCSIDQCAMVWEWNCKTNSVDCVWECRGHSQSVECVGVQRQGTKFATGSWDNSIKIWESDPNSEAAVLEEKETDVKKAKKLKREKLKTPLKTLAGHTESVSCLKWMDENQLVSCSWDHSLRLWDVEHGMVSQINGNVAFFNIAIKNNKVLGCCADRHIRLYDIRAQEGSIVLNKYTSHGKWVSAVDWCPYDDNMFVSSSYDNSVRVWDQRSAKAPLYSLQGHEDKVLAVDWSLPTHIASGSADCTAQIYNMKK